MEALWGEVRWNGPVWVSHGPRLTGTTCRKVPRRARRPRQGRRTQGEAPMTAVHRFTRLGAALTVAAMGVAGRRAVRASSRAAAARRAAALRPGPPGPDRLRAGPHDVPGLRLLRGPDVAGDAGAASPSRRPRCCGPRHPVARIRAPAVPPAVVGAPLCTPVWGYSQTNNAAYALNGASTYPSMNFRALKGRPVKVKWVNNAPDQHLLCPQPLDPNWPCAIDRTLMGVQAPTAGPVRQHPAAGQRHGGPPPRRRDPARLRRPGRALVRQRQLRRRLCLHSPAATWRGASSTRRRTSTRRS